MSRRKTIIQNEGFLRITAILSSIDRFRGVRGPKYWPVHLQLMIYSSFGDPPHNNMFFWKAAMDQSKDQQKQEAVKRNLVTGDTTFYSPIYIYIIL